MASHHWGHGFKPCIEHLITYGKSLSTLWWKLGYRIGSLLAPVSGWIIRIQSYRSTWSSQRHYWRHLYSLAAAIQQLTVHGSQLRSRCNEKINIVLREKNLRTWRKNIETQERPTTLYICNNSTHNLTWVPSSRGSMRLYPNVSSMLSMSNAQNVRLYYPSVLPIHKLIPDNLGKVTSSDVFIRPCGNAESLAIRGNIWVCSLSYEAVCFNIF